MIAQGSTARPRRSVLYVPSVNARAVDKARGLDCDAVVLDLEDAVAPDDKDAARVAVVRILREGGFGRRELGVRCNGLATSWAAADLQAVATSGADFVVVPKVSGPEDLRTAEAMMGESARPPRLWAMIETCQAVLRLPAIAALAQETRLDALMLGTNDLAAELRCAFTPGREEMSATLQATVMAARAFGLTALDGTFNDFNDAEGLAVQCRQGAALGFDGKTLVHPSQIGPANAAFSPSPAAAAWAGRVIEAFAAQPAAGVLKVDGQMVERLHLREAERIAALAGRTA